MARQEPAQDQTPLLQDSNKSSKAIEAAFLLAHANQQACDIFVATHVYLKEEDIALAFYDKIDCRKVRVERIVEAIVWEAIWEKTARKSAGGTSRNGKTIIFHFESHRTTCATPDNHALKMISSSSVRGVRIPADIKKGTPFFSHKLHQVIPQIGQKGRFNLWNKWQVPIPTMFLALNETFLIVKILTVKILSCVQLILAI